jgi:hypothetical protein
MQEQSSVENPGKLARKMNLPNKAAEIVVRDCSGLDEFQACIEIQKTVWGQD